MTVGLSKEAMVMSYGGTPPSNAIPHGWQVCRGPEVTFDQTIKSGLAEGAMTQSVESPAVGIVRAVEYGV